MNATQQQAERITRQIVQELAAGGARRPATLQAPVGISNRHVHLAREDMDILFGYGSTLTRMKAVKQPGQFAAEETVILRGPKGDIKNVRVLGPLRPVTQIEISVADGFTLGVDAPIRMSGDLEDSPGIELVGPQGSVKKDRGTIVAWRHIHISPEEAESQGLRDGMEVSIQAAGKRGGLMQRVIVRATQASVLELHIDVEEANAYGLRNGDRVSILTGA
ncbi:phosphate propanoyltransferase [Brenneria tiliae]|uniref:phosphate propanoyltransferase n=1 Tax=Brenneria tiliae TaxID=2914984 RepID=UPI002014E651|nr:phosphate propanoyltransferase [Brenneria tiliae]MCL2899653.1 phosphate propanoyltransferase [Brenneria tiliae]MCL2904031.1 phosphate propanoyltransferase [Brenneria tiliae]